MLCYAGILESRMDSMFAGIRQCNIIDKMLHSEFCEKF